MNENKRKQLNLRGANVETTVVFGTLREEEVGANLSTTALHKLSVPELVDKWDRIEGGYLLKKWELARCISDRFDSKIKFGNFLHDLRIDNPNHALCTINQSTFYRYARAARFCEKFKISDLKELGILPTAIYDLSEKANEQVIDESFIENIKNKALPLDEIRRLIDQIHSISGELISESNKSNAIELPLKNFERLETLNNEKQIMTFGVEEGTVDLPDRQLISQKVVLHVGQTDEMTQFDMVQKVWELLKSFKILNDFKLKILVEVEGIIRKESGKSMKSVSVN